MIAILIQATFTTFWPNKSGIIIITQQSFSKVGGRHEWRAFHRIDYRLQTTDYRLQTTDYSMVRQKKCALVEASRLLVKDEREAVVMDTLAVTVRCIGSEYKGVNC